MLDTHSLPTFLTVPEFAAMLSMPTSWVYEECRRFIRTKGKEGIPCKRFGRAVRINTEAADSWLEAS